MDFFLCCMAPKEEPEYPDATGSSGNSGSQVTVQKEKQVVIDLLDNEGENYQQDQWQLIVTEKRELLDALRIRLAKKFGDNGNVVAVVDQAHVLSPQNFLQSLTELYTSRGQSNHITGIREIFTRIQPFVTAVNTLVQTDRVAALVWGSLTLVFQSVLIYVNFWDDLKTLFEEVTESLPRFHGYVQVFHTPRLHFALRKVYSKFVDLCLMTLGCLGSNRCFMMLRVQWSSFAVEFKIASQQLRQLNIDFEKEAQLAHFQEEQKRYDQVMGVLQESQISSESTKTKKLQSNIALPRNEQFVGRSDILALIHSILEPGFRGEPEFRSFRSCLLHAIGGMGKTETALEYTYIFRHCYSYIVWLRSQTEALLRESFLEAVNKFGIVEDKKMPPGRMKEVAMDWFRSTDEPWLLVYDNVEDLNVLSNYWPAGSRGTAIITSQDPVIGHICSESIHLQPFSAKEGSKLIQRYLRRGDSEKEPAEQLSNALGGLPLAIAHFTGYISKTQCPIEHISINLNKRLKSSSIWKTDQHISSGARAYQHTLNTVWELAFHRLSADARLLLDYIAFLDPDYIPVDIFIGNKTRDSPSNVQGVNDGWEYWDIHRFNNAIAILSQRNLVQRTVLDGSDSLRTHRALQICLLHKLDEDLPRRAARFNDVVAIIRRGLPTANIVKRNDESYLSQFLEYIPQISSVQRVYDSSEPAMNASLQFASVLDDACFFSFANNDISSALTFAEIGDRICSELSDEPKARSMLPNFLTIMSQVLHGRGVSGQRKALELVQRVVELRKEELEGIPPEKWTELQAVNYARAHADLCWELCESNKPGDAAPLYEICVEIYTRINNKNRLALIYSNQLMVLSTSQKIPETRSQGREAVRTIESLLGENSPMTDLVRFQTCLAYFTIGDVKEALELAKSVFRYRSMSLGRTSSLTFGSQYCLAVFLQHSGDLESAETSLREILANGQQTVDWREDDIVRVKFRLSIILRAKDLSSEADELLEGIKDHIIGQRPANQTDFTDADDMALLDERVTLVHGRTAGIWSNGKVW
ncbi:pfs domain-containing protein [Xylaria cubensis]|nr:pfs domain-containing protein [Xylaria cubensis]